MALSRTLGFEVRVAILDNVMTDRTNIRGRWAGAACFFANGFMIGSWAPQIPELAERFALSETQLGLLILVFGIGGVSAMPVSGMLIGAFGTRPLLRLSAILLPTAFLAVILAPSLPLLVAMLALFGAMLGAMDVSMNANAVLVERRLGRAIMSSAHGFWSLGGFVGAGAGGLLLEANGYVFHAVTVGVAAIALAVIAWPHLLLERRPVLEDRGKMRLPRNPAIYLVGIITLFCMAPEGAVLDWAALYLREEMGASIAVASLAFTAFSGAMALMRFAGDGLRNRFGAVRMLRISGVLAVVGMIGAGLATSPVIAIIAFALTGLGIANMVPIAFSAAGNQPGITSSAGMSVATTIGYSGLLVAPSLIGYVAEHTGFQVVYLGLAGLLALVVLLAQIVAPADHILAQAAE